MIYRFSLPTILLALAATAGAAPPVLNCRLGARQEHAIGLFRGEPIADTFLYALERGSGREPLFAGEARASRGSKVVARCIGREEKVLLITGEFEGSNYPKGVLYRFNTRAASWQRIDFAERSRPSRVYLGRDGMELYLPNRGDEHPAPYIRYVYRDGDGLLEESAAAHGLPRPEGRVLIRLDEGSARTRAEERR